MQALLEEHQAPGSRDQLKELWTEWLDKYYVSETVGDASGELACRAETPPDSDVEEGGAAAGLADATAEGSAGSA